MGAKESSIKEIAGTLKATFDHIEKYPGSVTVKQCEELRRYVSLIEYYLRYGDRQPPQTLVRDGELIGYRCSTKGCNNGMPFFNLSQDGSFHFVCIEHIPPEMSFPIGLWGEDWEKSGRA